MNAIKRFWIDFAAWVKGRNRRLSSQIAQPIPIEAWADRKLAYARAQRAHRRQADTYAHLRKGTHEALMREVLNKDDRALIEMIHTHPWLFRDANTIAFAEAVKATARRRVQEARR